MRREDEKRMVTLRELFSLTYNIAELDITAREPDTRYIHRWIYGEYIDESVHMFHDRRAGKLTIIKKKIQFHGKPAKGGYPETGWGVNEKLIHKELIDAPITHLSMLPMCQGRGTSCRVDIEMQKLTALAVPTESYGVEEMQEITT